MAQIPSFKLLDGTSIPWLAWGNGTGTAESNFKEAGPAALASGLRHIDTAQGYGGEKKETETGKLITESGIPLSEFYITSKLSRHDGWKNPVPIDEVYASVVDSTKKLQCKPNLFLVHNPYVVGDGEGGPETLQAAWKEFEKLKDDGKVVSIGVSNFRPQDLEAVLKICKHKPVVNQLEFHPYVLTHLEPVLKIQEEHGIVTEAYGPLTPILRNKGGPIDPILEKIASKMSKETGKTVTPVDVLLLWTKGMGAVAVTASGNPKNIKALAEVSSLPDLSKSEIDEISEAGKKVHYRYYDDHMENQFPVPKLPSK